MVFYVRLMHGSVKHKLAWSQSVDSVPFDPVLVLLAEVSSLCGLTSLSPISQLFDPCLWPPCVADADIILVHGQVTIIFVVSVCLFVCAEFFSVVFDPISIKLGHMLYVWV